MTQNQYTDSSVPQDGTTQNDSAVIKELRQQIKDLSAELKSRPDETELRAALSAELARDSAIETMLVGFGHPKGIRSLVAEKLGDAEVTVEAVAEALVGIGYEVDTTKTVEGHAESTVPAHAGLAEVSGLSSRLQSTSGTGTPASDVTKVNEASSREELRQIAADGGWLDNLVG